MARRVMIKKEVTGSGKGEDGSRGSDYFVFEGVATGAMIEEGEKIIQCFQMSNDK